MASNVAPPKNTAGGGFVFEEEVCAWLLAAMLVGEPVFGVEYGAPVRLDFQTRPDGWFLDDVLATTTVAARRHRFALSVKSNAQFTAASAPSDFVTSIWEQWLHLGSNVFDATLDFIGIVTAPLSGAATRSLSGLIEKARENDSTLLSSRLETPNWASADERALFSSLHCPDTLAQATTRADTARLLQRLRFVQHDFGGVVSQSKNLALDLCRRAVRSQTATDAQTLWSVLRELASELRPQAGSVTLFALVERLRARVILADYPDHTSDWATLDLRSAREASLVRDSIADSVRLPRDEHIAGVIRAIAGNAQIALVGRSGVGKSTLAKGVFERRVSNGERAIWIDATSLDRAADFGAFEASMKLHHGIPELLASETSLSPLLIIDGIDRIYADSSFRSVAMLLRCANAEQATSWRVLAVCQSQEWPRVLEGLQRAGAPLTKWRIHEPSSLSPADLQPVTKAVPTMARLLLQPRVAALFTNLKLLDLVVRRLEGGASIDASAWVGESSVAEWFWSAEVDRGVDRLARGQFARNLAQVQADQLEASVSIDAIDASSLLAAQSLSSDQLLVQLPGDRLAFAHDLYGDWARLRVLLSHRHDLSSFLQTRHESPLWHRAIRLLGVHVLERENGIVEWKLLMASFSDGKLTIVRDLLLEAPAFAMNARPLLEAVFPDLLAGDGDLLRRLLTRFIAFATVPDENMQVIARATGMDANEARALFRRPHWPYWLDVIAVLHANRKVVLSVAAHEVAKLVEMWLQFIPPGSVRRREASEIAVLLGQAALDSRSEYRDRSVRGQFYKCALMAAHEQPAEVALLARTAAERIPRPAVPAGEPPPRARSRSVFSSGSVRAPWPDGPLARVDAEFQDIVLDSAAIQYLFREQPKVAREVILATLIEAPREEYWGGSHFRENDLDLVRRHKWHPALYTQGPFLRCLLGNFAEGVELITRLVDFATARAGERAEEDLMRRRSQAPADSRNSAHADEERATDLQSGLTLLADGSNVLTFEGDASVYCWSSGLGNAPDAIEASLMALEQYFYLRLDKGDDIAEEISVVLAQSRSVAVLGVLCDIGKRENSLFDGPLRPLLSGVEIYSWELNKIVSGRSHLMIGAFMKGNDFIDLAKQFHNLEHRKHDLRDVAVVRLHSSDGMQAFFAATREWWKTRQANGEQLIGMSDQLDLMLDPTNYETRDHPTYGTVLINVALERAQAESASEQRAIRDRILVSGFPMRCRSILDERRRLTDVQLSDLWKEWMRIRELAKEVESDFSDEDQFRDEHLHAIAGGVAVLLWHDEWVSRDESRRQVLESAVELIVSGDRPARGVFWSEHDSSTWTWDGFVAEASVMLLARQPHDRRWRRLVADNVLAERYATVRVLFARCAEFRIVLGDDFGRLRRLALDWAHVRGRVHTLRNLQQLEPPVDQEVGARLSGDIAAWIERSIASFVDGTMIPLSGDWSRLADPSRFAEIDALGSPWSSQRQLDFHLVRCSHAWMPEPDETQSADERASVVSFWHVALNIVAQRPRADLQRRDQQYPSEDEMWVLDNVAAAVLQMRPDENPQELWQTIIELHSEAHDWPENFLNALHRQALSAKELPSTYESLVREIVQRAVSDVDGERRWPLHEEVWDALIGINGWASERWSERHANHVLRIWDVIALWMEKVPQDGRRLGVFARWLSKAAAASVRTRVLSWFAAQLKAREGRAVYRLDDAEDDLARLLNVLWDNDQQSVRASDESFAAFRSLLAWLVERQNSLGLVLQGRIGGLM